MCISCSSRSSAASSACTDLSDASGSSSGESVPKSEESEPASTPRTATPVNMIAMPANLPARVSGTMSPYPTVVSVTIPHQNASPIVANSLFSGFSAWYAARDATVTMTPAMIATLPSRSASRRRPAVAISTRATRPRRASMNSTLAPWAPGSR